MVPSTTDDLMMDVSFHSDDLEVAMDESERTADSLDDFELDLEDAAPVRARKNNSATNDGSSSPRSVLPESFLSASMSQLGHASDTSLDFNASIASLPATKSSTKKPTKAKRASVVKKPTKRNTKKTTGKNKDIDDQQDPEDIPPNNTLKKRLPAEFEPSEYSVICGRGKDCFDSPGNIRFRGIIEEHMSKYLKAPGKSEKSKIVSHTMDMIRTACPNGGAFVKLEGDRWWEVSDRYAREKVGAWFRDCLHLEYKSSSKAKHARKMAQRKDGDTETLDGSASASGNNGKTTPTPSMTTCGSEQSHGSPSPQPAGMMRGADPPGALPPMGVVSNSSCQHLSPSIAPRNLFGFPAAGHMSFPNMGHPLGMPAHVSFHNSFSVHGNAMNSLDYSDHSAASFMSLQQTPPSKWTGPLVSNGMCHSMPALLTATTPGVKDHSRRRGSLCSIMTDGSSGACGAFYDVDDLSLIPFDAVDEDPLQLSASTLM